MTQNAGQDGKEAELRMLFLSMGEEKRKHALNLLRHLYCIQSAVSIQHGGNSSAGHIL